MDAFQRIDPFYPRRDLSEPTLQLREVYRQIRHEKLCKHLIEKLSKDPRPLISTFFLPAYAAEEFDYPGDIISFVVMLISLVLGRHSIHEKVVSNTLRQRVALLSVFSFMAYHANVLF